MDHHKTHLPLSQIHLSTWATNCLSVVNHNKRHRNTPNFPSLDFSIPTKLLAIDNFPLKPKNKMSWWVLEFFSFYNLTSCIIVIEIIPMFVLLLLLLQFPQNNL